MKVEKLNTEMKWIDHELIYLPYHVQSQPRWVESRFLEPSISQTSQKHEPKVVSFGFVSPLLFYPRHFELPIFRTNFRWFHCIPPLKPNTTEADEHSNWRINDDFTLEIYCVISKIYQIKYPYISIKSTKKPIKKTSSLHITRYTQS